jgi:hypothetical protein
MRATLSNIARATLLVANGMITAQAIAGEQPPTAVELTGGRLFQQAAHRLYEADETRHEVRSVRVPAKLNRSFKSASSIVFPASHSMVIDGKEYVLVVVNQASSSNPTGFCGVGEEGTLYVLELHDLAAAPRFSLPVQSCLKTIDLRSDGVKSPYTAISWSESPAGVRVSWDLDAKGNDATRTFRYEGGRFVEMAQ